MRVAPLFLCLALTAAGCTIQTPQQSAPQPASPSIVVPLPASPPVVVRPWWVPPWWVPHRPRYDTLTDLYAATKPAVVVVSTPGGIGAGVVVDVKRGLIVTCRHVVPSVKTAKLTFADGSIVVADVLLADEATDLAVLKIVPPRRSKLVAMPLGDMAAVKVGDEVFALGHPYKLYWTLTRGIVSYIGRDIQPGGDTLSGMIQTDAAINPGNSGGALMNRDGELIGINESMYRGAGGLGFAVSVADVRKLLEKVR